MGLYLGLAGLILASAASLFLSTITYALRDFSRSRLAEYLGQHNGDRWFELLTERTDELIVASAVYRQIANLGIWVAIFATMETQPVWTRYVVSILLATAITLFVSVSLPHAIAKYAAETVIGGSAAFVNLLRVSLIPVTRMTAALDATVRRLLGIENNAEQEEIQKEILSAVEEGEKEGVVDEQERELIENVIEFRDTAVLHIMTARPEIAAIDARASLAEIRAAFEGSGHSRLPIFEGSLDKIIGIIHARDLIKVAGIPAENFDLRSALRPATFVPETKPLRLLLNDFRQQKNQIAIVLDEYGGVSGLVTIEDILEELVGEISDEHEPPEPPAFKRLNDSAAEADARLPIAEVNRQLHLDLPEDAGVESIGGYVTTTLGRVPAKGTVCEIDGLRFTVLEAEPQRIDRLRLEKKAPVAADGAKSA
ncbi:MAG TPA: hemolysin family protein [Tepidisphaeraceae bacterium]|nr:hemolysin family protein [Tepidisphaeraceae bacterium]